MFRNQNLLANEALRQLKTKVYNFFIHTKNFETKVSLVAQKQPISSVPPESFQGQPEKTPKEHLNVVTTRKKSLKNQTRSMSLRIRRRKRKNDAWHGQLELIGS